jgi:hypothetical protein
MYKFLTASKELRPRARSALLDAYRRFFAQELVCPQVVIPFELPRGPSTYRGTYGFSDRMRSFPVSFPLPDISASLSHTVRTESDGSSVHTPDSTCAFHCAPAALTVIDDPNAEAFAALSRRALRLWEHLHRAAGLAEPTTLWRRASLTYRFCYSRTVIATCAIHTCYRFIVEHADRVAAIVPGSRGE